ncbi:MAG: cupin domain-containing protein [Proteobacteria bacterium]|nr:cupin domain-containing protein [Pseudomonadota bacterium]
MSIESNTGPQALNGLVEYQAGAVVSKEILRTKNGTVTFFAFDKEQGLSEHTAPFDVIVHIGEGAADITISGKSYTVKAGEVIKMPANEPHALFAKEKFKMMLIMLKN